MEARAKTWGLGFDADLLTDLRETFADIIWLGTTLIRRID